MKPRIALWIKEHGWNYWCPAWLFNWAVRRVEKWERPTVRLPYYVDDRESYRRREAQHANICLARRSSMKHERRNARRTLDAITSLEAKGIL